MAKQKRDLLDEIAERLGEFVSELDRILRRQKKQKRALVPIPVRENNRHDPRQYPPR